ncbi:MAG: acetolactate synthase large subunit [Litoreibacter sp.]|nr:acetolactate synthase large subunit [Litoreibacter sp.]
MNGAESLVKTFLANDVTVCFANPGTSEMHFVAALDNHPDMRCVLCLFEGGTSGAADGYYRMSGKVAATMLHLAPGFGNAFANLHNARKAGSGIVNVMGDHATYHLKYESPLRGNTSGVSQAVSHWTRTSEDASAVSGDGAAAIRAARSRGGQIATLILPADTAWMEGTAPQIAAPPPALHRSEPEKIAAAARALRRPGAALMIGGTAGHGAMQELAGSIARATGARLMAPLQVPRLRRGAGAPCMESLAYPVEVNLTILAEVKELVLCGANPPVSFFAYPGKPGTPIPPDCRVQALCAPDMDIEGTLHALADAVGADAKTGTERVTLDLPDLPSGPLSIGKVADALAVMLPEDAILVNESVTSTAPLLQATAHARGHDLLVTTGGAIGQCLPAASGAAIACPDRSVFALSGDGSAMYTLQSLWTMARERLDVTVLVFANRGYQILRGELANLGIEQVGRNATRMFDVEDPTLDWCSLAKGHGVPAARAQTSEQLIEALKNAKQTVGPYLIEVALP